MKERLPSFSSLDLPRPGSNTALTPNNREFLEAETQPIVAALSRRSAHPGLEIRPRTQPDYHDQPSSSSTPNAASIRGPHFEDASQMQASQDSLEVVHRPRLFFASQQEGLDHQNLSSRNLLDGLEDACMPPTPRHSVTSLSSLRSSTCSTPEPSSQFLHSTRTGRVTKISRHGRGKSPVLPKDKSVEAFKSRHLKSTKEKLSRKEQGLWGKLQEVLLQREGIVMEHRLNKGNSDRSHGNAKFKKTDYLMCICMVLLKYQRMHPEHIRWPVDQGTAPSVDTIMTFEGMQRQVKEAVVELQHEEEEIRKEIAENMRRAGRPEYKTKKASLRRTARKAIVTPPESEVSSSCEESSGVASSPRFAFRAPRFNRHRR